MKEKEILETFRQLARSQGHYGRLLGAIENMEEDDYRELFDILEAQNFKDPVDLILYVEG